MIGAFIEISALVVLITFIIFLEISAVSFTLEMIQLPILVDDIAFLIGRLTTSIQVVLLCRLDVLLVVQKYYLIQRPYKVYLSHNL